jgi:hypothetical protein
MYTTCACPAWECAPHTHSRHCWREQCHRETSTSHTGSPVACGFQSIVSARRISYAGGKLKLYTTYKQDNSKFCNSERQFQKSRK